MTILEGSPFSCFLSQPPPLRKQSLLPCVGLVGTEGLGSPLSGPVGLGGGKCRCGGGGCRVSLCGVTGYCSPTPDWGEALLFQLLI